MKLATNISAESWTSFNQVNQGSDSVVGGFGNTASGPNTFIGGGSGNIVSGKYSSILGGINNNVSGNCSAIFGGSGNSDGGFDFVGIFGNGLVATVGPSMYGAPSAMWVDSIIVPNIPVDTSGTGVYFSLPPGALYTTVAVGPWGSRPIFVK